MIESEVISKLRIAITKAITDEAEKLEVQTGDKVSIVTIAKALAQQLNSELKYIE